MILPCAGGLSGSYSGIKRQIACLSLPKPRSLATPTCPRRLESPGTTIGPYKLMEEIGEGGMGIVYVAEQTQPVRRKVALKIIKPGHGHEAGDRPLRG